MENKNLFEKHDKGMFLYIRHGQTHFNKYTDEFGEYAAGVKREFLDCPLSDLGITQAESLQKKIQDFSIKEVYCSPLTRCLETCLLSLKNHPRKENLRVVIHPLITETVNNTHDFSQRIFEKKKIFSKENTGINFDWSVFDSIYPTELEQELFYVGYMDNLPEEAWLHIHKIRNENLIIDKKYEEVEDCLIKLSQIATDKKMRPESLSFMLKRHMKFKDHLKSLKMESVEEKVLIYTHSNFIMVGTSNEIFKLDKFDTFPVDCYKPENCEIISMLI